MLNYRYQQYCIARHYTELVQTQAALRIKVDAGCLERKQDLEIASMVVNEFYYAMKYTYQSDLAMDIDDYFENYVKINQNLIKEKDFKKAEENLNFVTNINSLRVLEALKADCLLQED